MQTITYDGMEFGLETFLDAYGFTRMGELYDGGAAHHGNPHPYMAVLESGELIQNCEGRMLPWPQVLAFRPAESADAVPCSICGALTTASDLIENEGDGALWCGDCWECAEWEY